MIATHGITTNGNIHVELKSWDISLEDEIRRRVLLLDGDIRYAWMLWRLPPGRDVDQVPRDWPFEYIQTAGTADRATVEIRTITGDGPKQFAIGRPVDPSVQLGEEVIAWDGHETVVRSNEVFTSAEAAELFVAYYLTDTVPSTYARRLLDL